jgi:hypothetical protein
MGFIRYSQARRANKLAAQHVKIARRSAAAAELQTITAAASESSLSPEQRVRIGVAVQHRKRIERALKAAGLGRSERGNAHVQVTRLISDGASVDAAIDEVLRWRREATGET